MIYWADRGDDTINRAPIAIPAGSTAATRADRQIIVRQVREAIGVAIDKRRGRLYYTGANGQLGRANLDGSNKMELTGARRAHRHRRRRPARSRDGLDTRHAPGLRLGHAQPPWR